MADFTFRIRFELSPSSFLAVDTPSLELASGSTSLTLRARERETPINKSRTLILEASGYGSAEEAESAGRHYEDVLLMLLTRLRIGVDFGHRTGHGAFVQAFLDRVESKHGIRALNDVHGLMVYETEPETVFMSLGRPRAQLGSNEDRIRRIFGRFEDNPRKPDERDRVAIELFNQSFFVDSADLRLVALVTAVECLVAQAVRDHAAQEHVNKLVEATRTNPALKNVDRNSLLGSLAHLRTESVGQACKRLVRERLDDRAYRDLPAVTFFSEVYTLRSTLVHGGIPYPAWSEVSGWVAPLEVFVSDLITHPISAE